MNCPLDELRNLSDEKVVKYAHIIGDIQRFSYISEKDRVFLKDIFYDTMDVRYCDLSNQEMRRLRAKVVSFSGIKSFTINPSKGVTI